jgi:uncharacterized membrane protein YphA (DoxX/SURF4 family)
MRNTDAPVAAWSLWRRFAFRLLFAYMVFFSFGLANNSDFDWSWLTLNPLWHALVPWLGKHVLHLQPDITIFTNGSGDTRYDWLLASFWVLSALVAAIVWSLVDRRRAHYEKLFRILRVWVRYALAYQMLNYGFAKIFKLQFPMPDPGTLTETYGESSPMKLAWTFMGYSPAYTMFGGWMEVIGGALLLFRRTTTLGALVLVAVLSNVVMLNYCYDVDVKLLSAQLLLMAVWLVLPDARRLVDMLVLHRPTQPLLLLWQPATRRGVWARRIVKYGLIAFIGISNIRGAIRDLREYGDSALKPMWYGAYEVEQLIRGGKVVEQRLDDPQRWRIAAFGRFRGAVRLADGTYQGFATPKDGRIEQRTEDNEHHYMSFAMPDANHVVLSGKFLPFNEDVKVTLKKLDDKHFLLLNRGFHLINELPFNH